MKEQFKLSIDNLTEKLLSWVDTIILIVPNLIIAILVFGLCYAISTKLKLILGKLFSKYISQRSIRELLVNLSSILVICIGLFLALSILNLDKALSSILAGAGVVGLAVGLALQGTLANTFSGIFLSVKNIMNVGDFIETNGFSGVVMKIDLRHIHLIESDNNIVIIPNKLIVEKPFKNFGLTNKMRISLSCGVGYESNLKKVKQIAISTIKERFPQQMDEIEFHYLEFGDSSIKFQIRFWVEAKQNLTLLEAKSEALMAIKEKFDNFNISIPYPIRTVYNPQLSSN